MGKDKRTETGETIEDGNCFFRIRKAEPAEWETAMELAFKVFLKFEAQDYGPEGIKSFADFVSDERLKNMFLQGEYLLFVAMEKERMIGLISLRSGNHISLLFVDPEYHRRGVGSALIRYMQSYLLTTTRQQKMTVNASPYGVPFYHKVGFVDTGGETTKEGIIYTPMEFYL